MFRLEDKNGEKLNVGDKVRVQVTLSRQQEGIITALGTPMSEILPDREKKSVLVLNVRMSWLSRKSREEK